MYVYFFWAAAKNRWLCKNLTSRTVSLACSSQASCWDCHWNSARWPLRPPIASREPSRVKSRQYGPSSVSLRSKALRDAPVSTACAMSACWKRYVRSIPSASSSPAVEGRSHSSALAASLAAWDESLFE